ncbi:deleted in malignant brain tumors 1 protein-like [Clupea harengus]|uniref:Deleted in malignant brain tumors 1 protein-like n=1 Tax=Clupea harengus TaxID=7950 RepID=A0A6P8GYI7_CLUHA|nr:deleted in malignant brain tumors 1 protein-like [Clupea harengus]
MKDAEVVCRQLGCGKAVSAPEKAYFGEGSGKTWLDDVGCSGNESSITQCSHSGFGIEDCSASEDAGVFCSGDTRIRVVNGDNSCSGRVEIYHNGTWGTICDNSWDMNDAEVVCRQLGCGKAVSAPEKAYFGQGSGKTWLDDVGCSGNESSITQCKHNGFGIEDCGANQDAGVVCSVDSSIQLANSSGYCSGRVEIYHNGTWGTICDDPWDMNDAEVVCRQLGCGKALRAPQEAYFGQGSGKTWLDDVKCCGNESSITQCSHRGFGIEDCKASEDAGVVCSGNMKTPSLVLLTTNTALLPGESAEFRCAITSHRPVTANFRLYRNQDQESETKTADQKMMTFSLSSLVSSDQGSYTCDYYYQGALTVSSPKSNAITITIVSLVRPQISAPAGEVTWGQSLGITCSISTQHTGGSFTLKKGSFTEMKSTSENSVTFTIHHADFSHEGSYYCQYQTTVSNRKFTSPQSNTISVSVVVRLHLPRINCTAPEGGLSWGPSGLEITKGYSFSITCSTQPQFPGGVFYLSFSGSNSPMTQPATNHSASFYFPAANYSHQGNYSCVYRVDVSSRHFYSTETEKLTVTIREFMVPFIAAGVTGGVVFLLFFGLVCIFWARRKQTNTRQTTWKCTRRQSKDKDEDEDQDDYENVEMEDQDDFEDEDQDDYENVEMEDQDDYENVEIEDQADCEDDDQDYYEIVEDYMEELDTGLEVENIYGNC